MATGYSHLFLRGAQVPKDFTTPRSGGGGQNILQRDRSSHSIKLRNQWESIWTQAKERQESRTAVSLPTKGGVYVEFEGAQGYDLITKSLEDRRAGIRLLNVYTVLSKSDPPKETTRATVFIPLGQQEKFLNKVKKYAEEETEKKRKPKHADLVQSVEDIRLAVLESFWRDDPSLLPQGTEAVWCEIWLSGTDDDVEQRFLEIAATLNFSVQARSLRFPERMVLLSCTTREQLVNLIESSSDIAEFRRAKETARFFFELDNKEQTEWVKDLHSRLQVNPDATVAVCVLDTGANNGHVLLQPVLADDDLHAVKPSWGVNDNNGHGTLMCGGAVFGDLTEALQCKHSIRVDHFLESV